METASETTPLLSGGTADKDESSPKLYFKKNRTIYLIAVFTLVALVLIAAVAIVWYLVQSKQISPNLQQQDESLNQLLNNSWPRPDNSVPNTPFSPLVLAVVEEAVDDGKEKLRDKELVENNTKPIQLDSASYRHQFSIVYSSDGYNVSKYGYIENEATKYLQNKGYTYVIDYKSASDLKWSSESKCNKLNENITCDVEKYRTINGSCNNLNHPQTWGVAMTPFRRSLPANYSDGVSSPRGGFVTDLPSARDVSTMVHRAIHREDINFSVMLAVWGQFIDHDITATALSRGANGSTISCCNAEVKHPECFPVLLGQNDEYYSKYNLSCMEFVRSAPALRCLFGPREQLNQASSYLDGSMIYGNTEILSKKLRTYQKGLLEMSYTRDGRSLLPISTDPIDGCNQLDEIKEGRYCFLSGDARANENSHLTSIHLIFARQHNEIAKQLAAVNPHWDDETLYQEARRILTAQVQHVTYSEFLPIIIGSDLMTTLKLYPATSGFWTEYNSTIDATIANNFAASSFRFAHTLIPRLMKVLANDTSSPEYVQMHKMLFNPFRLYKGDLDAIIRGAMNTDIEKADNYFTDQLTQHLFESPKKSNKTANYGLDLVALNIQRGRDHGLPTYPHWREYCGFPPVSSYKDLETIFDKESLKTVSQIYKNVEEIDLYTGSLSEIPIEGGLVGPTITCLITDQFYRLKYGDRFWYETNEAPQAFTEDQLNEIRKTSLAGIICQNADNLDQITPKVMRSVNQENNRTSCSNIPQPDLSKFKDSNETSNETGDYPKRYKIVDLAVKSKLYNASWKDGFKIPKNLTEDLFKYGISWKGVVTHDLSHSFINGNFSVPVNKDKVEGEFRAKVNDFYGTLKIPSETEIWSPVFTTDNIDTYRPSKDRDALPMILFGKNSSNDFQWNGEFGLLDSVLKNQTENNNLEQVDYQSAPSHNYEKSKRTWVDPVFSVDEQPLNDLLKKIRDENRNNSETLAYLDSILGPEFRNNSEQAAPGYENQKIDPVSYVDKQTLNNLIKKIVKESHNNSEALAYLDSILSPEFRNSSNFAENEDKLLEILRNEVIEQAEHVNSTITHHHTPKSEEEEAREAWSKRKDPASDTNSSYVDEHVLESLLKKVRKENRNDSEALAYLDSILSPELKNSSEYAEKEEESRHETHRNGSIPEDELLSEIFAFQAVPNYSAASQSRKDEPIRNITFVVDEIDFGDSLNVTPPIEASKDNFTGKFFKWEWHPETNSVQGNLQGDPNGNFTLKYKTVEGCCLKKNCSYYSEINSHPTFDLIAEAEPNACTVIAPLVLDNSTWNGNVTVAVRDLDKNLEKEDELSLNPTSKEEMSSTPDKEHRIELKNITGTVSLSLDGENVFLWNGTFPAELDTRLNWMKDNNTVAYPVSWSGIYIQNSFVGNFLLPEKKNNTVVWHEGDFYINLGNDTKFLTAGQVYTTIVYLTTLDDVAFDVSDLQEYTDWELNQYARILLKGEFQNEKFYWNGDVTFVIPKIVDESKSLAYRPIIRYSGQVLGGSIYAQLYNTRSLWWSGEFPSKVLIPAETPRDYKHIFNQAMVWSFNSNGSINHATFITYGNNSLISLSGVFDFEITSLLNSPPLSPNVTYYSPIILQQKKFDLSDDLSELYKENPYGIFTPIALLGKFLKGERKFVWKGKFIISLVDN